MSARQSYPHPQAFMVDSGGGEQPPPGLVPCWIQPPAQERGRSGGKGRGCSGTACYGLALALLFVLLLVLAALGLGAYQILRLQEELTVLRQETGKHEAGPTSLKQIGLPEIGPDKAEASTAVPEERPAAHVIGGFEKDKSQKTLRWDPKTGRAFTAGGVVYQDGGLQVNHTGLYQVYSRVEFSHKDCGSTDAVVHSVFLRRPGHPLDLVLMEGNWEGYCSSDQGRDRSRRGRVRTFESSLSSGLQLQKHDRVYVNVTQPGMLSHHHHANFFGLYKI